MKTIFDFIREGWKPQLLPNFKHTPDWETILPEPDDFLVTVKLDGIRIEFDTHANALTRSLKPFRCVQIKELVKKALDKVPIFSGIIEAEIYDHSLTFAEIKHFVMSSDVTSAASVKKHQALWKRTEKGKFVFYEGKKMTEDQLDELDLDVEQRKKVVRWALPGRTPEWACTWPKTIKLYGFNLTDPDVPSTHEEDTNALRALIDKSQPNQYLMKLNPRMYTKTSELTEFFNEAVKHGYEGLVLMHKNSTYKHNRITLNERVGFKMKDDDHTYTGTIICVEEGTYAREGAEREVNELGRSVTSKRKEDRVPGGYAKGFQVRVDDGTKLVVTLVDYSQADKELLWKNRDNCVGDRIKFRASEPVKAGGAPRHARYYNT